MAGAGVPKPRTNKDFNNEKNKIGDKRDKVEIQIKKMEKKAKQIL